MKWLLILGLGNTLIAIYFFCLLALKVSCLKLFHDKYKSHIYFTVALYYGFTFFIDKPEDSVQLQIDANTIIINILNIFYWMTIGTAIIIALIFLINFILNKNKD